MKKPEMSVLRATKEDLRRAVRDDCTLRGLRNAVFLHSNSLLNSMKSLARLEHPRRLLKLARPDGGAVDEQDVKAFS